MRMIQSGIMITVIHELILLWCVHQMRILQRGIMITVIHELILLWCVRQIRMVNAKILKKVLKIGSGNQFGK